MGIKANWNNSLYRIRKASELQEAAPSSLTEVNAPQSTGLMLTSLAIISLLLYQDEFAIVPT